MKSFASSFWCIALIFGVLCTPLIFSRNHTPYSADEDSFHLPAVRQIYAHWPRLDIDQDSLSAISPGYHYMLATASLVTGTGRTPLRLITWILSLILLWLLWRLFPAPERPLATAAILPLACSNFYVKSASWIVTDNPALLGMGALLTVIFFKDDRRSTWLAGLLAAATTFIRQMYVWTIFPIALRVFRPLAQKDSPRLSLIDLAAVLPACAVLLMLVCHWHGLVPPAWKTVSYAHGTGAASILCYMLAVFFLLGVSYHLAVKDAGRPFSTDVRVALVGALFGLFLAIITRSDYNEAAGRWGGYLWNATRHLPIFSGRSLVFLVLTPLGGALFAVMATRLIRRTNLSMSGLWLGAFAAWAASLLPNGQVFQRYFEPTIIIFLIFWISFMLRAGAVIRPSRLIPLVVIQLLLTLATAHRYSYFT